MKKIILLFILLILNITLFAAKIDDWTYSFRINASFMRVTIQDKNNDNPKFTGIYQNNEITSWLVGSKFIFEKNYGKSILKNTLTAKYGETNKEKSSDELAFESLYRFLFKHIDSYFATEFRTVFNEFGEPNIYKLSAGGYKTFIKNNETVLESRIGVYGQKQFSPKLNTVSGIELINEYTRTIRSFNKFESKAEFYTDFEDLKHLLIKWDNTFISKISEALSIEYNYLLYYETKPKDYDAQITYNEISSKRTAAISLVYDFK
jgi:hypothetical protein